MAASETRSEQSSSEIDVFNRLSALFLLGACVGFAIAVAGFATGAFYLILAGSCVTLAMTLLWVASGMLPLARTIRSWSITGVQLRSITVLQSKEQ